MESIISISRKRKSEGRIMTTNEPKKNLLNAIAKELGWEASFLARAGLIRVKLPKSYKHDFCFVQESAEQGFRVRPRRFEKEYPAISAFLNRFNAVNFK